MFKKLIFMVVVVFLNGCNQDFQPTTIIYQGTSYAAIKIPELIPHFIEEIKNQNDTPAYALNGDSIIKWDYDNSNIEVMNGQTAFWKKNGQFLLVDSDKNYNLDRDNQTGKKTPTLTDISYSGSYDSNNVNGEPVFSTNSKIEIFTSQQDNSWVITEGETDLATKIDDYLNQQGATWGEPEREVGFYETITKGKVVINGIPINIIRKNNPTGGALMDTWIFDFNVTPSFQGEMDIDDEQIVNEDFTSSVDSENSEKPIVLNYAEVRGTIIKNNINELKDVLGEADETWRKDTWTVYLYYFKAEKFGELGHVRVSYNYLPNSVESVDFFSPGDRIKVSPVQYVNSPSKP